MYMRIQVANIRKGREAEGIPGGYSSPAKGPARKTGPNRAAARPIVAAREERVREKGKVKT